MTDERYLVDTLLKIQERATKEAEPYVRALIKLRSRSGQPAIRDVCFDIEGVAQWMRAAPRPTFVPPVAALRG